MISSIAAGFNTVANHIGLILLPVILDLFVWLGPQVHISTLISPMIDQSMQVIQDYYSADLSARMQEVGQIWNTQVANFNLVDVLRTFPIGVPSLMSGANAAETPLGAAVIVEATSGLAAFGLVVVFLIGGFILGCVYFNQISRATAESVEPFKFQDLYHQAIQALGLSVSLFIAAMILVFPVLVVLAVFALISASLADLALLFMLFLGMWIIIPMLFTPHSIFSDNNNLVVALMTSVRLVRSFLPSTGLFLLIAIVITQGLDLLWMVPPTNSWLTLVGIFGHAFVYTSVLAASFVYYRGGLRWMQQVIQNIEKQQSVQA